MKIKACLAFSLLLLFSASASAGWIVRGGTISLVTNTGSNQAKFGVKTTGGTGPCAEAGYITFPFDAATNERIHTRAYSAALTAFTTGVKVNIHNYENDACDRAVFIELTK